MLRITNIKMPINTGYDDLFDKVLKILNTKELKSFKISKKSIDARKKTDVFYVYNVDIEIENEEKFLNSKNIKKIKDIKYSFPKGNSLKLRPVIIGTGPAGLFAGLVLAQNGYNPVLLERGDDVDERTKAVNSFWSTGKLNTKSNVQFGEGGAGTFSDGKLTTGIKDFRIKKVLEEFVRFGAPEEILYLSKPHIGTDILKNVVKGIRLEIVRLGGEVRFNQKAERIITEDGKVTKVLVTTKTQEYEIETNKVILAIGHSARDTFSMLKDIGVKMSAKPFSVGMRIEHSQEMINKSQYGEFSKQLPSADYKLSTHLDNGRGVYTFCMCPGGFVVNASSECGGVVTNGMSNFARNEKNANSAVLVSVTPDDFSTDDPLAGLELQRKIEEAAFLEGGKNYNMPIQTVGSFLKKRKDTKLGKVKPTILPGYKFSEMRNIFPEFITKSIEEALIIFDKKILGFASDDAVLTAPETRSSSPVRIGRDNYNQTNIIGLYSAGEGGGHAGGIISSAVDGIKTAELIVKE